MFEVRDMDSGVKIDFKHLTFPGGEEHVTVKEGDLSRCRIQLTADLWSSKDVLLLMMLNDALRRLDAPKIKLLMKYVPYARQDRVANVGEALSIRVFCELINSMMFDEVEIWDPHSDVPPAFLDRVRVIPQHELFTTTVSARGYGTATTSFADQSVFVAPDAGAVKKTSQLSTKYQTPMATATKHRDTKTGVITGTTVDFKHIHKNDFWVVDDICDGGRTFTELAKALRPLTDGKIYLYVTHGIFSKGFSPFIGLIDEIFCANVHPNHVDVDQSGPIKLHFLD